jgi:predicted nucleotide-binding protein
MPYHVRVTCKSNPYEDEVRLDLSLEELQQRFLRPYQEGRPIVIGGKTVPPDDLARIRINETDEDSEQLRPRVEAERRRSNVISGTPVEWYIANKGKEVTDDFITGPPGSGLSVKTSEEQPGPTASGPRVVFVVHGRNQKARDALFSFLRSIGLHPLEWLEAIQATGKPSPYIGDILDAAFSYAQAIVVLFSPDDEARLREQFQSEGDPSHEKELTSQARPNVLFEAGMAMGRDPDRTVLIEVGHLRPFSDIAGRHVVRLDNSTQRRQELAQRLEAAGCPVNLTGTDWHTAGDIDSALN